jgi:hypothetical protein
MTGRKKPRFFMAGTRKPPMRKDQPRPSVALDKLREALGFDGEDWQTFLWHARHGLADFERANLRSPRTVLRLREVPASWFEHPDAIGYVFLHVFTEAGPSMSIPAARHLLTICDSDISHGSIPPGTGLAWLQLARAGLTLPIEPARLAHLAMDVPADFFGRVAEEDLPALCRLVMEARGTIEAWDLHAVITAVDMARIHVRAPFRLFESLITADWITAAVKREFCRGLLECRPETQRLKDRADAIRKSFPSNLEQIQQIPRVWRDISVQGLECKLPVLKRHAVYALVENIGEPLPAVIDEFFLRSYRAKEGTEAVSEGVLDLIGRHAEDLGPDAVQRLIKQAIKHGLAPVRQAAFRIGAHQFGLDFARPALKDEARLVRDWAAKLLATKRLQPARKTTSRRRTSSSPAQ